MYKYLKVANLDYDVTSNDFVIGQIYSTMGGGMMFRATQNQLIPPSGLRSIADKLEELNKELGLDRFDTNR